MISKLDLDASGQHSLKEQLESYITMNTSSDDEELDMDSTAISDIFKNVVF